jgi:hypothetical protein
VRLKPLIIIEKGIIQPSFNKTKHTSFLRADIFSAGVLTSTGLPVRQSKAIINERDVVRPHRINISKTEIKYIDADAIYFCIPQNHFGHVLTGTMASAYILLNGDYSNHKIVFVDSKPCEAIKILLKHLGAKEENIITINEYTQFKSVAVVKQSLRLLCLTPTWFSKRAFVINEKFIDTFRAISEKFNSDVRSPSKVYFSRSKLTVHTVMGEERIEKVFKNNGYEIFYPEQLPLDEQIKLVANADFYACVQGTLEHHSLFMKDGATLIVMARHGKRKQKGNVIWSERQVAINKLQRHIKHINLRTNIQPIARKGMPLIIGATKDLIRFFDKNKFIYDAEELKPTYEDLRIYINKCFSEKPERCFKKKKKRLLIHHKDFWKHIK